MIEDHELAQLFRAESAEHLARLDDGLLHLEKTPTDQSALEEVFRESHSLKGAARMLGLLKIETAAHGLESILNAARKGEAPLTPEVIERMNVVLVELRKLVQLALDSAPPPLQSATPGPATIEATPSIPQPASTLSASPVPVAKDAEAAQTTGPTGEAFHIETVRVETRKLDDLLTLVGELSVVEGRVQHRLTLMDALLDQWALLDRNHKKGSTDCALRIAELGKGLRQARDAFYEDSARLESTVNTLEEQVHAARLLPLSTLFALFPRMVRDLARAQGKEVELVTEGGEIGVDKRILEEMKDPLMHLLRNAIDHGIEASAERMQLGKPRGGTVRLRAARESGRVLLEVRDDGRGLDAESIRQAALKRRLYDEAALAAMNPAQLQQLIFAPGFSTSNFITELSGRGVGLDVVRVNVERLKGDIRMDSVPRQGTAMQIRLPLSLATTHLLLVGVGDRLFGLPIEFVYTSRRVREEDIFPLEGLPALNLDGQPVIAPRLADLLGLPALPPHPQAGAGAIRNTVCIVLQVGDERLGVRVDELLSEEEVVTKPLGAPLVRVRNVSGLTILGSGKICAVLNPADLLRTARKKGAGLEMQHAGSLAHSAAGASQAKAVVLLAEDSALVRAMEKRILEDAGYEVVAAVDGMAAFNMLGQRPFAAVVSDIMMPNMNGLTLVTRIRQEPRYKNLPVILVTTLNSDEDKRRGLEAGANAYIPKPSFDQRLLLDTLQRLIVK